LKIADGTSVESEKAKLREQCLRRTKDIEVEHGAYWGRRANIVLTMSLGGGNSQSTDAQILLRVGSDAERKQQWKEAIDAYEKAAVAFESAKQPAQQFAILYRTGLIFQQLKQHENAYRRFLSIAKTFPTEAGAADASLSAIWNLSQVVRGENHRLTEYAQLLDTHLERWLGSESAAQALIWRARLNAREKNYVAALDDLLQVDRENKLFSEAIVFVATWIDPAIAQLEKDEHGSLRAFALELSGLLESKLSDEPDQIPEDWSQATRDAALLLARINLVYLDDDGRRIAKLLKAAWADSPQDDARWRSATAAWTAVALSHSRIYSRANNPDRLDEIKQWLDRITDPQAWSNVAMGLKAVSERSADPEQHKFIAQVQLLASASMEKQLDRLDEKQKVKWALTKANALETNGQRDEAVSQLEKLVQNHPRNLTVQTAFAGILSRGAKNSDWEQALGRWRLIASRTPKNSPAWFRAKYYVASMLSKMGKHQQARELLEFIKAVGSGWSGSELQSEFDELFRRVKNY